MSAAVGSPPFVVVEGVSRRFHVRGGARDALRDVSLEVHGSRTLAIVGRSGSGKTTLSRLIAGLDRPTAGAVRVDGAPPVLRAGHASPVQMVFQSPKDALNAYWSVGRSIAEPLRGSGRAQRRERVAELLEQVGLDASAAARRPASFSGGQLQRIGIARALAARPKLLLCDEPTSALDVSVQAQIVNLLLRLQAQEGFAMVLVTHDLGVVRVMADDVLVLHDGAVVEHAPADRFFAAPQHPHSQALLAAVRDQSLGAAPLERAER